MHLLWPAGYSFAMPDLNAFPISAGIAGTWRPSSTRFVDGTEIWAHRTGIPHRCLLSSNVQGYFEELIDDAQEAILSMLGQRTLLQALTELEIRESAKRTTSKVRQSAQNKR